MAGRAGPPTRRACLLLVAGLWSGLSSVRAGGAPSVWRDLGGFWLLVPADLAHKAGGLDSRAGQLTGRGVRIDYDLGIYSDPLAPRSDAIDREQSAVVVDGRPAVLVRWRREQPAPAQHYLGLHLPQIGQTPMGPLRLTLLAAANDARTVEQAQPWLLGLRLSAPTDPARP